MDVVELVARIGDTVLDVAHLTPGVRYRIGSAPDVDLAVSALGSFPVVDGDIVRVPAGLVATVDNRRDPGPTIRIAGTIVLQVGLVTLTIRRAVREAQAVPRPRRDRRPYPYLAASLVVQLALWLAAVTLAPFERITRPVHRIVHVTHVHPPDPPPPPAKPEPAKPDPVPHPATAAAAAHHPRARESEDAAPGARPSLAASIAHLGKTFDDIHVADQLAAANGPADPEGAFNEQSFGGGGRRFDVDAVAPPTTFKVERWAVPTFMHMPGQLAPVPAIAWCNDDSCMTRGTLPLEKVLAILEKHQAEIARCYREHTGDLVGEIRVRFPIAADGRVTGTLGTEAGPIGYGTGTVGRCVAKIAQRIRWPQAADETYVFVGLAFRPA